MSDSVQFTSATNFIAASAPSFAAVPIKYFLPAYCAALDPFVTAPEDMPSLEDIFPPNTVKIPDGVEVIYNVESLGTEYKLSNDRVLYYTPGQNGVASISGSDYVDISKVNMYDGFPLSTIVSGTSFSYSDDIWTVGSPIIISGVNNVPVGYANNRGKFFSDVSFQPMTSGTNVTGLYKMKMGKSAGTFKYNILIPYITRFINSTTEDTSIEPVMFGALLLKYPIIKTNIDGDGNFSNTEHDLSIQFSSNISDAQNHLFLDGGYWFYNGLTNSLSWDGDVVINTSAVPGSWVPDAKLTVINTDLQKSIFKATYGDDLLKKYFYVSGSMAVDDTVYSRDTATVIHRSGNDIAPTSFVKQVADGSSRRASIYLANDDIMIRGGWNPSTDVNYFTAGISGNSIQIISGGLDSKVLIGATSAHNQLLSQKYTVDESCVLNVFGSAYVSTSIGSYMGEFDVLNAEDATLQNVAIFGGPWVISSYGQFTTAAVDGFYVNEEAFINKPTFTSTSTFNGAANFTAGVTINSAQIEILTGSTNFGSLDGDILSVGNYADINYLNVMQTTNTTNMYASNEVTAGTLAVGGSKKVSKIDFGKTAISGSGTDVTITIPCTHVNGTSTILVTPNFTTAGVYVNLKVIGITPGTNFQVSIDSIPAGGGYLDWIVINP